MDCLIPEIEAISLLWYIVAVAISFLIGALWYGLLFPKTWIKAIRYECECGADVINGEKCSCSKKSFLPTMIFQLISTALVVLVFFILTPIHIWLSILVVIAIASWMKSNLKFQISDWKRFVTLALIDVGYFTIVSIIGILFSLI